MICVFDCETIPDVKLLRTKGYVGTDLEISIQATKEQEYKTGDSFCL